MVRSVRRVVSRGWVRGDEQRDRVCAVMVVMVKSQEGSSWSRVVVAEQPDN